MGYARFKIKLLKIKFGNRVVFAKAEFTNLNYSTNKIRESGIIVHSTVECLRKRNRVFAKAEFTNPIPQKYVGPRNIVEFHKMKVTNSTIFKNIVERLHKSFRFLRKCLLTHLPMKLPIS